MSKLKILLIDDHQQAREALMQRLSREADFLLQSAPASAPELVSKKLEWSPDVILIDVKTTFSDGIDICRQLKQSKSKRKILILTSFLSQREINVLKAAGAADVFVKDLDISELLCVIRAEAVSEPDNSEKQLRSQA